MFMPIALLIRSHPMVWHGVSQIGHVWHASLVLLAGTRGHAHPRPAPLLAVTFTEAEAGRTPFAPLGAQHLGPQDALHQLRQGQALAAVVQVAGRATPCCEWLIKVREPGAAHDPLILLLMPDREPLVQLAALRAGADAVLEANACDDLIRAQLDRLHRRVSPPHEPRLGNSQGLHLDLQTDQAWAGTHLLPLKPQSFRLLHCLMAGRSRVHSLQTLHAAIRSRADSQVESVHAYISRLRKILRPHGLDETIQTVHGVGYRYLPEAAADPASFALPPPEVKDVRFWRDAVQLSQR